ncbi:MAG: bifunctional acetate--CoA ligase family protein/GNAT family N-acetyltransferase [Candidatus Hydrogenedentes bacterium]|nr:bifunctional acetate--CoA ligase family protein/GNAT family N-acetyltransferase [Candidatus Hydrogenedentota bacterium]
MTYELEHETDERLPVREPLRPLFAPRSVAVIGASDRPGSIGRALVQNLISSPFGGTVYPVNPKYRNVLGIHTYPKIASVPEAVDLALIATRAATVPDIVRECVDAGVKAAAVISSGFREIGAAGRDLEQRILAEAQRGRMRVLGPNSFGIMNPISGLNATFAHAMVRPGSVGFISQSGALNMAVLDWSLRANVGFSAFLCAGSMTDIGWGDLIDHLGNDLRTRSIVIYMETIDDAQTFLSAARRVSLKKPIIILKGGETEAAARAAASHVGALAGSDQVFEAAFRRSGVLRVRDIESLFRMAEVLGLQPRPKGPRLTILTNAGGFGILATDALLNVGAELAPLSPETLDALDKVLPPHWSHSNPINVFSDADLDRYARTIEIAANNPESDGLLLVLTPQAMIDPTQTAERLKTLQIPRDKPMLACLMGGVALATSEAILKQAGIPTFPYPDIAARVFYYMWRYTYNLRGLYETPSPAPEDDAPGRAAAAAIVEAAHREGRVQLSEAESKAVLAAYGIPVVETRIAETEEDAVAAAAAIGYPVALKVHSDSVVHKSERGGVRLHLSRETEVRAAYRSLSRRFPEEDFLGVTVQPMVTAEGYELILGSTVDPQFGPVILFGAGGALVEMLRDRAVALAPLNSSLALRLMEQTRVYKALQGFRGRRPVDVRPLQHVLTRLSRLVMENPRIRDIDINPMLAGPNVLVALDAAIILHPPSLPDARLPKPVIRPYPQQYVTRETVKGAPITFRPIRPEDEPLMVAFHEALSDDSVYYRFLVPVPLSLRVQHETLAGMCSIDYSRDMGIVAEREHPGTGAPEIVAVGRLNRVPGSNAADFALVVCDHCQGLGLGRALLGRLIDIGREEGLELIIGTILPENRRMLELCRKLGFRLVKRPGEEVIAVYRYATAAKP